MILESNTEIPQPQPGEFTNGRRKGVPTVSYECRRT